MNSEPYLQITRTVPAPIEEVFRAWTDPEIMTRWFFAGENWTAEVSNSLEVGGSFRITMDSGSQRFLCTGTYREIDPPRRLVFTWSSYAVTDSLVTLELRDLGEVTELTLLHEGLVDAAIRDNHAQGWGGCLTNLEHYFAALGRQEDAARLR